MESDTRVYNPQREMFVDYGSLFIRVNKPALVGDRDSYQVALDREVVRPQCGLKPSPFLSLRPFHQQAEGSLP